MLLLLCTTPLSGAAQAPSVSAPSTRAPSTLSGRLTALEALRTQRKFQTALDTLTALVQRHPDRAAVLWRRALVLTDLGKQAARKEQRMSYYRHALDNAEAALQADSTAAWPHAIKALVEGRLCLNVGRRERARRSEALKHYAERALALDSTLALGYHMLGRWHRHVAALNFIERQVAGSIYNDDLPDASLEQSVRHLKRALALETKSYHYLHLAHTYLQMDREDAARRTLHHALDATGSPLDPEYKADARTLLQTID